VLVAHDEKEKRLYAIERAQKRRYALCKLGTWVTRQQLEANASAVFDYDEPQFKRQALQVADGGRPWWSRAAVGLPDRKASTGTLSDRLPKLAVRIDSVEARDSPNAAQRAQAAAPPAPARDDLPVTSEAVPGTHLNALDTLQELAKQYLETLYLSRTSLAYFTKGPLSRARAAFSGQSDTSLQPSELTNFLREAILSAPLMDKKYRDTIPGIVKEFPVRSEDSPEQPHKSKKKRKWKAKRDKAGLFFDEKDYLERWWRTQDDLSDDSPAESVETGLKRHVPRVRSRETYLQLILALEVLALEAAHPTSAADVPTTAGASTDAETQTATSQPLETQDAETQEGETSKKKRAKKPSDLPALLDTLVDRLCIWHSFDSLSPAKKLEGNGDSASEDVPDELRSFCIEVIIPFYMSRIPQHAVNINKKLGGPSAPTPVKRQSTSTRRPGEPAARPVSERKPGKPLSRVASEALTHPLPRVPALHRSATDTNVLLPTIKREGSETPAPMDKIPPVKAPQPRKRTNLLQSIKRREVDLSAMSQANAAKANKNAELDQKLKEAVSAIRKPNRALAVKEIAESADASHAQATTKDRVAAGTRKKTDPHKVVHVTATPKHPKAVKVSVAQHAEAKSAEVPTSSGTSYVPASSMLSPVQRLEVPPSTFAVPQTGHRPRHATSDVAETPSRGFAKFMPPGLAHEPGTLESPIMARKASSIDMTPLKPIRSLFIKPATPSLIAASPNPIRATSPSAGPNGDKQQKEKSQSIYDVLGWDDEYEDLT
jgi:DNA replication regulator SLD3